MDREPGRLQALGSQRPRTHAFSLALLPSPSRTLCRSSATCWPRRIGTSGRRRSWYACPPGVLRASPRLPTPQAGSGRALGFKSQMGLSQEVTQPSEPQCPRPSDDRPTARGSGRGLRKRVGRRVRAGTWQSLLIWRMVGLPPTLTGNLPLPVPRGCGAQRPLLSSHLDTQP